MAFKMSGWSAFTKENKYKYNKQGKIIGVEKVASFGDDDYEPTELDEYYDFDEVPENVLPNNNKK
tara:strand:- start:169 stop:363 length:195 start_codon:yes stop_codon:yes gene_type:complete